MRILSAFIISCLFGASRLVAVYAPVPELEQGKPLTVYLVANSYYDTNIFGGSTNEVSSYVYELSPSLAFNASLDAQTFASAGYHLTYDYMADRPGKKSLDSHEFSARLAHTFTPQMEISLGDTYQISRNPESLLPGVATVLSTDQSYHRNQFDARYATSLTKRTGLTFKGRHTLYNYENASLSRSLDHSELLVGVTLSHTLLPELQAVAEYRHQTIDYDTDGLTKNKRSDFALAGLDYALNAKLSVTSRLGVEQRHRSSERSATLPYAELGLKYDYGHDSYVSAGYGYSVEETSNIDLYTDMSVNRFFLNLQQALTGKITATTSITWEPSRLHGRQGVSPDKSETNTQAGLALSYRLANNWSISATCDYDRINSADSSRELKRLRTGLNTRYVF